MTWLFVRELLLKHWRAVLLAVLVTVIVVGVKVHLHNDAKTRAALAAAEISKQLYKAELDRVLAQLADADKAAKQAIAEKAEAEKAAQKRLQAREKFWQEKYRNDPKARAWASEPVPASVLDGLRQ